jgi:hypothetical protein
MYSNRWDLMKSLLTMHFYLWWRWWSDTLSWVALTNHLTMTHDSCHVCVGWWCQRNKHLPEAELRGPLISGMPCSAMRALFSLWDFFFLIFLCDTRTRVSQENMGKKRGQAFSKGAPWLLIFKVHSFCGWDKFHSVMLTP